MRMLLVTFSKPLITFVMVALPLLAVANCDNDHAEIVTLTEQANNLEKKGDYDEAQAEYRKAARKLSSLKYRCSKYSFDEMSNKEQALRDLAALTGCGRTLEKGHDLLEKGKVVHTNSSQAQVYYNGAITIFNEVRGKCSNSSYAKVAQVKIAETNGYLSGKTPIPRKKEKDLVKLAVLTDAKPKNKNVTASVEQKSVPKSLDKVPVTNDTRVPIKNSVDKKANKTENSKVIVTAADKKLLTPVNAEKLASEEEKADKITPKEPVAKKISCFSNELRDVVALEKKGNQAWAEKNMQVATADLQAAAKLYDSESKKCTRVKDRLAALDRAKVIRARLTTAPVTVDAQCEGKIVSGRELITRASQDEEVGKFIEAKNAYTDALKIFSEIPNSCLLNKYSLDLQKSKAKSVLLACHHYIEGIKVYNQAVQAMSVADNTAAARLYTNAIKYFDQALGGCQQVAENVRLLHKLKQASVLNQQKLGQ